MATRPPVLSTIDAAKALGLKPQTLRSWRLRGIGPKYIRVGNPKTGRVVYKEDDIYEYLDGRTFRSVADEKRWMDALAELRVVMP